eukprot:6665270-Pyramimonas_sp.AAC.1
MQRSRTKRVIQESASEIVEAVKAMKKTQESERQFDMQVEQRDVIEVKNPLSGKIVMRLRSTLKDDPPEPKARPSGPRATAFIARARMEAEKKRFEHPEDCPRRPGEREPDDGPDVPISVQPGTAGIIPYLSDCLTNHFGDNLDEPREYANLILDACDYRTRVKEEPNDPSREDAEAHGCDWSN